MRNEAVFEGSMQRISSVFNDLWSDYIAIEDVFQCYQVQQAIFEKNKKWRRPQKGFLKLNINGSWKKSGKSFLYTTHSKYLHVVPNFQLLVSIISIIVNHFSSSITLKQSTYMYIYCTRIACASKLLHNDFNY